MTMRHCLALGVALLVASPVVAQESSQEDFRDFLKAWEGRWEGKIIDGDGVEVAGHADCRVLADGNVLLTHVYLGEASGVWLVVYNRGMKQIQSQWGQSDGEATRGVLYKDGEDWIQKGSGCTGEGAKLEFLHRVTASSGGQIHTWDRALTIDGKQVTGKDIWKRGGTGRGK